MVLASVSFWDFNIGQVVTVMLAIPAFWAMHSSIVRRIRSDAERMGKLEEDVKLLMESKCPYGECPLRAHVNMSISGT